MPRCRLSALTAFALALPALNAFNIACQKALGLHRRQCFNFRVLEDPLIALDQ